MKVLCYVTMNIFLVNTAFKVATLVGENAFVGSWRLFHCEYPKPYSLYVVRCAIWYYLYNLKNVKNTHGGMLILVKLQAERTTYYKRMTFL